MPITGDVAPEPVEFRIISACQAAILYVCRNPHHRVPRAGRDRLQTLAQRIIIAEESGCQQAAQDQQVLIRISLRLGEILSADNTNSERVEVVGRDPAPGYHSACSARRAGLAENCDVVEDLLFASFPRRK